MSGLVTAGVQMRADGTTTDLWHTARHERLDTCWAVMNPCNHTDNRILNVAGFVEEDLSVGKRLRILAGMRFDQFAWQVDDLDPETADTMATIAGSATAAIVSPKLSAIIAASDELDLFVNTGLGFHSNDARAAVATDGDGALAQAIGAEGGARVAVGRTMRASAALWYLRLASEIGVRTDRGRS
jgi:outer membrane receptor for Fe3+-dicitrate